ncbi:hypothetical protein HDU92_004785 [Lobulomyces angularis]|nr:hypothetical protein HDU92_004785 [Lobulomyces angularis]
MSLENKILLLGATGRVGRQVLEQLLVKGNHVKAIVRSKDSEFLKPFLAMPNLLLIEEKNLSSLKVEDFSKYIEDVETVICTLGHAKWNSQPKSLVLDATKLIHLSVEHLKPSTPKKLIMLGTSGILNPESDRNMGLGEKILISSITYCVPQLQDSKDCVDYISKTITKENQHLQWTIVRPTGFLEQYEDGITEYKTLEKTVYPFYNNGVVRIKNIANFFVELAEKSELFETWKGKMPIIADADQKLYN